MRILIINVGGSSTKILYAEDGGIFRESTVRYAAEELNDYDRIWDQYGLRKDAVVRFCRKYGIEMAELDAIVSRGPNIKPVHAGVYRISKKMVLDARSGKYGIHPCGMGCQMALELGGENTEKLTVDPPSVDEMIKPAKYTGHPMLKRKSKFHALNHRAVGRLYAEETGSVYKDMKLVICHLGSGVSIATHKDGKVIDVTNGLDGDGPFGLDRLGTLPSGDLIRLIQSGEQSLESLFAMIDGFGGMRAHLGTNNAIEVEHRIDDGDVKAREVYDAMVFQVAKGIGAASAAMGSAPDAIIITGGMAYSKRFENEIMKYISWIAPVRMMPGEDEMNALFRSACDALKGREEIRNYNEAE